MAEEKKQKPDPWVDLLAVQRELPRLQASAINPHFKSKYIPLEAIMAKVLPILNKHNYVLLQQPTTLGGEPALVYRLVHTTGAEIKDTMLLLSKSPDPQAQGSALTYARRYSLMALLGLVADEDDDAERATPKVTARPQAEATGGQQSLNHVTEAQLRLIGTLRKKWGEDFYAECKEKIKLASASKATKDKASELIDLLQKGPSRETPTPVGVDELRGLIDQGEVVGAFTENQAIASMDKRYNVTELEHLNATQRTDFAEVLHRKIREAEKEFEPSKSEGK